MQLDILLVSPGLPHSGDTLAQRSLGGSETAAIHMARCLAARGHHVTVASPGGEGVHDGVTYMPIEQAAPYGVGTPHDVTVVSRQIDLFLFNFSSKVRVLWCHDLGLKRNSSSLGGILWNLDALYVLSEFHKRQHLQVNPGLPERTYLVTRNGVDLHQFEGLRGLERDPHKLVYGSRPERGLENALAVMELLGQRGSPLRLHVSWYDNTPAQMVGYYEALWARARAMPNVTLLGPLTQARWHQELATARALIYPACAGDFREVYCILAAEAQACGTPIVAAAKGALPETMGATQEVPAGWVSDVGTLLGDDDTDVMAPAFREQFAGTVAAVCADDASWDAQHRAGLARAARLDWSGVAAQWEQHWLSILAGRASNADRLRRHFARIGERTVAVEG